MKILAFLLLLVSMIDIFMGVYYIFHKKVITYFSKAAVASLASDAMLFIFTLIFLFRY
jgi:hypothetical protein